MEGSVRSPYDLRAINTIFRVDKKRASGVADQHLAAAKCTLGFALRTNHGVGHAAENAQILPQSNKPN